MGRPASDLDDSLDWQERLENYKASDLEVDVFCLQEGVSRSTFYRWVDRLKDGIPESMVAEKNGSCCGRQMDRIGEDVTRELEAYIRRSTLCDWVQFTAELFRPLYELQRERVLQSSVMWTDDTSVTVLGGRKGSFQGQFWTYITDEQPYLVYDFTKSRGMGRQVFSRDS